MPIKGTAFLESLLPSNSNGSFTTILWNLLWGQFVYLETLYNYSHRYAIETGWTLFSSTGLLHPLPLGSPSSKDYKYCASCHGAKDNFYPVENCSNLYGACCSHCYRIGIHCRYDRALWDHVIVWLCWLMCSIACVRTSSLVHENGV